MCSSMAVIAAVSSLSCLPEVELSAAGTLRLKQAHRASTAHWSHKRLGMLVFPSAVCWGGTLWESGNVRRRMLAIRAACHQAPVTLNFTWTLQLAPSKPCNRACLTSLPYDMPGSSLCNRSFEAFVFEG